jgi:hypothetical protein
VASTWPLARRIPGSSSPEQETRAKTLTKRPAKRRKAEDEAGGTGRRMELSFERDDSGFLGGAA